MAQYQVARLYLQGRDLVRNPIRAAVWAKRAALQEYAPAELLLSRMYRDGLGLDQNRKKSMLWLVRAAKSGFGAAQLRLGLGFLDKSSLRYDRSAARLWLQKAWQNKIPKAGYFQALMDLGGQATGQQRQAALQLMADSGKMGYGDAYQYLGLEARKAKQAILQRSGEQWFALAVKQYAVAAAKDSAVAMEKLAQIYAQGLLGEKDPEQADQWFKKAVVSYQLQASLGNAAAQRQLGLLLQGGKGTAKNSVKAYMWLNIAAAKGDRLAFKAREKIRSTLSREQLAKAQLQSRDLFTTAQ